MFSLEFKKGTFKLSSCRVCDFYDNESDFDVTSVFQYFIRSSDFNFKVTEFSDNLTSWANVEKVALL